MDGVAREHFDRGMRRNILRGGSTPSQRNLSLPRHLVLAERSVFADILILSTSGNLYNHDE
jgi:hypothetical protein